MLGAHDAVVRQVFVNSVHFLPDLLFFRRGGGPLEPDIHIVEGRPQNQLHPLSHGLQSGYVGNHITRQPAQQQAHQRAHSFNHNCIQNITPFFASKKPIPK